jgi:hypothetical protein
LQFVGVDGVDDAVEDLAEFGVGVGVVTALQDPVDGVVKVAAGGFQMAGFVVLLAG